MNQPKLLVFGVCVVVAIAIILIFNPFIIVSAGERGVILEWGAVSKDIMGEGIHWRTPIKQKVERMDVRIQKEEVDASAASKDLQNVTSKIALNYHLNPDQVNLLWQKIGKDYKQRIIDPAIQEAVKASTAKYTAEELITKRESVKEEIRQALKVRLADEYITVDQFSIVNFDFSKAFNEAIENKVTNEQNAMAAKNKLEQVKFEAEQRIAQARGEAEAIKIQAEAITQQGGKDYVQLKAIERWSGNLPTIMLPNASVPFLNLDLLKQ